MPTTTSHDLLAKSQNNIDDIRSLASCKICLRPFYEPFMLNCGHTFCYGCLRSWVCGADNRKKKRSCPECRANIRDQPAPNYALRDLAHMFIDRAELLPPDETLEEHSKGKQEEAKLLADDRQGPGLFKNVFKNHIGFGLPTQPFWDSIDGVHRCPDCNWELEEGLCSHCGYDEATHDSFDEDDSDDGESLSDASGDSDLISDPSVQVPMYRIQAPEGFDPYGATDASETNTDGDPYPWGYRAHPHHPVHGDLDEPDEEDWEDEADDDDMGGFIDDDESPLQESYQSDGTSASDDAHRLRRVPFGESDVDPFDEHSDDEAESDIPEEIRDILMPDTPTNYDESSDDDGDRTPVPIQPQIKRRINVVISDEEDDDDDEEHDEEVFQRRRAEHESQRRVGNNVRAGQNTFSDLQMRHNTTMDESDAAEEEDDNDSDDEPISSSRRARPYGRREAMQLAQSEQRQHQRVAGDGSAGQRNTHGYHPYARRQDDSRASSNNRYRTTGSTSGGGTRTTYVY